MRIATLAALCLVLLASCKKGPQPTLTVLPDGQRMMGGDNVETEGSILFHTLIRYPGHAEQAISYYAPQLEKLGAARSGDTYADGNVQHAGDFGRNGSASVRDPGRPGVWLAVAETPEYTAIDIWENVPKAP